MMHIFSVKLKCKADNCVVNDSRLLSVFMFLLPFTAWGSQPQTNWYLLRQTYFLKIVRRRFSFLKKSQ